MRRLISGNIALSIFLTISGITSGNSDILSAWADKNVEKYRDIEDLSKDIDNGKMDDDSIDWNDFNNLKLLGTLTTKFGNV